MGRNRACKLKGMEKIIASIDMGTNTFRLLIAEKEQDTDFKALFQDRKIVRMGEGLAKDGRISQRAFKRGLAALWEFKEAIDNWRVKRVIPVATSVFREAKNADEFLRMAEEILQEKIKVISGNEEARLCLLGALKGLPLVEKGLLFDIGGGSTEFILFNKQIPLKIYSIPLGVVKLTERYMLHDPPTKREISLMNEEIKRQIAKLDILDIKDDFSLIGTAGTVTTLAAIDLKLKVYDPFKVQGYCMRRDTIEGILSVLLKMKKEERLKIPGLEKGREDLIIAGVLITLFIMDKFGKNEIFVSDFGLREGIIIDALCS